MAASLRMLGSCVPRGMQSLQKRRVDPSQGLSGTLTQPQQQQQERGQHYLAVLLDQRVLSPAGWQESRMGMKEVTGDQR